LYSVSLIYYTSGLLSFSDLTLFLDMSSNLIFKNSVNQMQVYCLYAGLTGLCVSLFFKLSAAPFHFWTPEVYEGAPVSTVFIFSTITKLSIFAFLVNIVSIVFAPYNSYLAILLLCVGVLSILVGMFGAFYYSKITKIIAFGATSHVGYVLVALSSQSPNMVFIVSFYFLSYLIATIIFFTLWLNIAKEGHKPLVYVQDLSGFSKISMPCSVLFSIALFSFAGIPPFAGFIAKVLVIQSLIAHQYINSAVIVLILSAVSAVYYLRFVRLIFFANTTATPQIFLLPGSAVLSLAWFFCALLLLVAIIFFLI
jgi:NADH-quinone oxidoreductase subunit N